jgi:hypothetical protein
MISPTSTTNEQIDAYLAGLDHELRGVRREERNEILKEIRTHILESLPDDPQAPIEPVLRGLGSPDRLAEHYRTEFLLSQASHSFSPWLLLSIAWRWAHIGIRGFVVFLVAVLGYSAAAAFLITVLLKAFLPNRIGLWVGRGNFEFGTPASQAGLHEVLGRLYIPATMVLAFAAAVGTTHALRWLIRTRKQHTH